MESAGSAKVEPAPRGTFNEFFLRELSRIGISAERFEHDTSAAVLDVLIHRDIEPYTGFVRDYDDVLSDIARAQMRHEPESFCSALNRHLDFEHPQSFADTTRALEIIRNLYIDVFTDGQDDLDVFDFEGSLAEQDPSRYAALTRGTNVLAGALRKAIDRRAGSYLLHERARAVYETLTKAEVLSYEDQDAEPFQIAPHMFAAFNHDRSALYIAPAEQNEDIKRYLHATDAERELSHYDVFYGGIIDAGQKIDADSLARTVGAGISPDDLRDFYFLQSQAMRDTIKRDFEIEISNLSLQDQYKLLRVLKAVDYGKANKLMLEATRAMWAAGVKDYLSEIRGGSLEKREGKAISAADRKELLQIQHDYYAHKYPEGLQQDLMSALERALGGDSQFYLYRKNGGVVSFMRFDPSEEGLHLASFMTNPDFSGGAIGQALFGVALREQIQTGRAISAECDPPLVPFYERFGFRLLRGPYADDHGVPTCDIVLESASASEPVRAAA